MKTALITTAAALMLATIAPRAIAQPAPPADDRLEAAVALYSAGDFANAAILFESLYGDTKLPDALFGWAQSLRQDDRCAEALALYKQYLAEAKPEPHQVEATNEAISLCPETPPKVELPPDSDPNEGDPKTATAATATTSPSSSSAIRDVPNRDWVSLGLIGVSSAAAATSLTFYVLARSANSDADAAGSHADFLASADTAESRQRWSQVAGGVAVAGLAGLLAWKLLAPREKSTGQITVGPNVANPGVFVQTRF